MDEVTVVQGLQAEVVELRITVGQQRLAQRVEVVEGELGVQQLQVHGLVDEGAEILGVGRLHFLEGGAAVRQVEKLAGFVTHGVQQQPRRGVGVIGLFLDAGAGGQRQRLAEFRLADAVVQIAQCRGDHFFNVGARQTGAGFRDHGADAFNVERHHGAFIELHVNLRAGGHRGGVAGGFGGALPGLLVAVDDVGAGHLVFAGTHQAEFDLVLNVFNVQGAAAAQVAGEGLHHLLGDLLDGFTHPRAGGGGAAFHGEKGLGDGDVDLAGIKAGDLAVAANHADGAGRGGRDIERAARGLGRPLAAGSVARNNVGSVHAAPLIGGA